MAIKGESFLKAALLITASAGLSGCVYDVALGFASDGYYDDAYACDPSGGYDAYYNCDYGQAFSNIGFSGGWYDNYYHPGHGIFLFDTFGRRYPMREQYRRYWGERRHSWYRADRGRGLIVGVTNDADAIIQATRRQARQAGPNATAAGCAMVMTFVTAVKVGVAAKINGAVATAMVLPLFQSPVPRQSSVSAAVVAKSLADQIVVGMMALMRPHCRANPASARVIGATECGAAVMVEDTSSVRLSCNGRLERNLLLHPGRNAQRLRHVGGVRQMNTFAITRL